VLLTRTEPSLPPTGEAALTSQWVGRVIDDRYRIVELLGEGGMGAVFVAEHLTLRKLVALKIIRSEFASNDEFAARFAREALATAQVEHPHVASAIDFGQLADGGAFLVIQLVRGRSLTRYLEKGPMPWPQAAELAAQIADGLAAAHQVGIVHRDLKPDNILIGQRDGDLFATVVDFGIARISEESTVMASGSQPMTSIGAVIGTPGYMAPEQAMGERVDHRVDLYALGVILWEMVAGRRLWKADNLSDIFKGQLMQSAPPLQTPNGTPVPAELSELVAQLLIPVASKRPDKAATVRDHLRRIAAGSLAGAGVLHVGSSTAEHSSVAQTLLLSMMSGTGRAQVSLIGSLRTAIVTALPQTTFTTKIPRRTLLGLVAAGLLLSGFIVRWACADAPEESDTFLSTVRAARLRGAPGIPVAIPPSETATTPAGPADDLQSLPEAFVAPTRTLFRDADRKARRAAAETITGASEADKAAIPEYIRNIAWLENGSCEAKKRVLEKIGAAGDTRVLPALRLIAKTPRNGCRDGLFRSDCLECLREDLARVIGRFETMAPPAP
jgi:serine/threonine-protein kinase